MPELGQSANPRELVPGDAEGARAAARALVRSAGDLQEVGDGLARLATPDGWRGPAADRFHARFAIQPAAWFDAADKHRLAGRALDVYAETLGEVQVRAAVAARLWDQAQEASRAVPLGAPDPGEEGRSAARTTLARARQDLADAGDTAADAVAAASNPAVSTVPRTMSQWAGDLGREFVNGAASVGNALLHDGGDIVAILGGAQVIAAGAAGDLGSLGLDATGIGALAGVPLAAVSTGAVAAGASAVGVEVMHVAQDATGADAVAPLGTGPPPATEVPAAERPVVESPKLANIVDSLYRGIDTVGRVGDGTTADAVRSERATGELTQGKPHIKKANQSIRALKRWLRQNPSATPSDRGIAQDELSNLLDALGRTE